MATETQYKEQQPLEPVVVPGGGAINSDSTIQGQTLPTTSGGSVGAIPALNPNDANGVNKYLADYNAVLAGGTAASFMTSDQLIKDAIDKKNGTGKYDKSYGGIKAMTLGEDSGSDIGSTGTTTDTTGNGGTTMTDVSNVITGDKVAPTTPSFEVIAGDLRRKYGIDTQESDVNDLKNILRGEQAYAQQRILSARRDVSRMDAINGRVSQIEEQENYRIDELNRQLAYKVDVLNSGYSAINSIMQWKQTDYANAKAAYDTAIQQSMQMYEIFRSVKNDEQRLASANLQIYMDGILNGSYEYAGLDDATKLLIGKLEIQSGLAVGTLSGMKMTPGANVVDTSSGIDELTGYSWTMITTRNFDGTFTSVKTPGVKVGMSADERRAEADKNAKAAAATQDKIDKQYQTGKYAPKTYSSSGGGGTRTTVKADPKAVQAAQDKEDMSAMERQFAQYRQQNGGTLNNNDFIEARNIWTAPEGKKIEGEYGVAYGFGRSEADFYKWFGKYRQ